MQSRMICVIFFISWLICGCSVDQAFDDPRAAWTMVVALIVIVVSAWLITGGDE